MISFQGAGHVNKILNKDKKLCLRYYSDMMAMLKKMNRNNNFDSNTLNDIGQNAFEVFLKNLNNGKFSSQSSPKTYLIGIARNMYFELLKNKHKQPIVEPNVLLEYKLEPDHQPELELIEEIDVEEIKHRVFEMSFKKLTNECKKLIRFSFKKKDKFEIADKLGYTNPENVRERLYRCKMRLVKFIMDNKLYKKHLL